MEKIADAGEIVVSGAMRDVLPSGATGLPKDQGWLLRWRRAAVDHPAPVHRHPVRDDAIDRCVPVVLRAHLRHGAADPEHRVATVGFLKFGGVDAILADEGPDAVADALAELVSVAQEAVDDEGVTFLASDLDKDGGKLILAGGVPASHEDDEGRVLRAVRRIMDTPCRLAVRIGVHRGHVFAGEIGTRFRSTYTVMGDTVNTAARLMASAPPGSIYASPQVLEFARTLYATTSLPPLTVKGKSQPLEAYAVGPEIGARSADTGTNLPFVGRERELADLAGALEGGAVCVRGPAGIGKSRLLSEALLRTDREAGLSVRAEPYGAATPYRPFREALRAVLDLDAATPDAVAGDLRAAVAAVDPALVPFVPLLASAMNVAVDGGQRD
jgi:class 3 adenylate cyclase